MPMPVPPDRDGRRPHRSTRDVDRSRQPSVRAVPGPDSPTTDPGQAVVGAPVPDAAGAARADQRRAATNQEDDDAVAAMARIRHRFETACPDAAQALSPCLPGEVDLLEHGFGVRLPAAYRAFLRWAGHGGAGFMGDCACFSPDLPYLQLAAAEVLAEDGVGTTLPWDAIVVMLHHPDGEFSFVRSGEGGDPPVHRYRRGHVSDPFVRTHERYSALIAEEVETYVVYLRERP